MNINDLYAFMPEDLHGSIAVSQGAVTITQDDGQPPFVLYKASQGDNPDLVLNQSDVPRPAGMWDPPPTLVPQAPLDEDVNYYIEQ
jgi:hypothetical protein